MLEPLCPVAVRVLDAAGGQQSVREMLPKGTGVLVLASRARCAELSLTPFFTALQGDGHAVQLYSDIPTNPSVTDVAALLGRLREVPFEPGAILAIGGGSCIDLGKAAGALYHLLPTPAPESVREAIVNKTYCQPHPCVDVYAMPTPPAQAEVTRWATIWDADNRQKLSVDHANGYPKGAVLIPEWTLGMPASLTLATGLDALSHAMESYWSVARNPLSQELALLAARKVCDALPKALAAPEDLPARREMCMASLLAGLAFSQTRTTAPCISYPLTMLKGLPHGYAVAVTLSSVMRRNAGAVPEMERLEAVFDEAEGLDAWLAETTKGIQPLRLSAFGITEAELPAIQALTFTAGRMDNNPVRFTPEAVMEILLENL